MSLDAYLSSAEFRLFLDTSLRQKVCETVDRYLQSHEQKKQVDAHQLYTIRGVVAGAGLDGLRDLAKNQKEKNTTAKNQEFWSMFHELVSATPSDDHAFSLVVRKELEKKGFIEDENVGEKAEQKKTRKQNRAYVDIVLEHALPVLFEHFICHYSFQTRKGVRS